MSSLWEDDECRRTQEEVACFDLAVSSVQKLLRWQEFNSEVYFTYSSGPPHGAVLGPRLPSHCVLCRACTMSAAIFLSTTEGQGHVLPTGLMSQDTVINKIKPEGREWYSEYSTLSLNFTVFFSEHIPQYRTMMSL